MGKVKKVVMDESQAETVEKQASEKKQKYAEKLSKRKSSVESFEELYTDLAPHVAWALREARVKPEQLVIMPDGEITAIPGVNDNALEEIRAKYPAGLAVEPTTDTPEEIEVAEAPTGSGIRPANKRHLFRHGKAIRAAKSKIDRTKTYAVGDAVKLVKATNITKFDATVTVHINLMGKDAPTRVEVTFPNRAGTAKRIAIANDELLADIEAGKIEFDVLLTTPAFMPKLAKFARVLGPKGLMPSPKAGTVTPDPASKAKEFAAGKTVIKAESKFPLMHVTVGKVSQPSEELAANISALLDAVKPRHMSKAILASTMSPGIKLQLN